MSAPRGVAFCFRVLSAFCCLRWAIGRQWFPPPTPTAEYTLPEPMVLHGFRVGGVGRCRNFSPDAPPRECPRRGASLSRPPFLSALCCLRWAIGRQSFRPPIPTAESRPPEPMVLHGFRVGE